MNYDKLTIKQLKNILDDYGLSSVGNKTTLIQRLSTYESYMGSDKNYLNMHISKLRDILRNRNLSTQGSRAKLIYRLEKYDSEPLRFPTHILELDIDIMKRLDYISLLKVCEIDNYTKDICDTNYFWRTKLEYDYDVIDIYKYKSTDSYKKIYNKLNKKLSINDKFIYAIDIGFLPIVKNLIQRGADIHYKNDLALINAIIPGYLDVVKYLTSIGDYKQRELDRAFPQAVINEQKSSHIIEYMKVYPNDPIVIQYKNTNKDIHSRDGTSKTSRYRHLDIIDLLIDLGANIHAHEDVAVDLASYIGSLDLIKHLIKRGANIYIIRNMDMDQRPINNMLRRGYRFVKYIIEYMIKNGDTIDYDNALYIAATKGGDLKAVKYLISMGTNIYPQKDNILKSIYDEGSDIKQYIRNL